MFCETCSKLFIFVILYIIEIYILLASQLRHTYSTFVFGNSNITFRPSAIPYRGNETRSYLPKDAAIWEEFIFCPLDSAGGGGYLF